MVSDGVINWYSWKLWLMFIFAVLGTVTFSYYGTRDEYGWGAVWYGFVGAIFGAVIGMIAGIVGIFLVLLLAVVWADPFGQLILVALLLAGIIGCAIGVVRGIL